MSQNSLQIRNIIKYAVSNCLISYLKERNIDNQDLIGQIVIDRPADTTRGDYSTNIALSVGKKVGKNPVELAISLTSSIQNFIADNTNELSKIISKVEVAGAGFINFYLNNNVFGEVIIENSKVISEGNTKTSNNIGRININEGKKIAYEYTDPNPFKVFHIGHLMSNTIGESLSRLGEFTGAEIKRFCYQGDIGRHVALFIYGLRLMKEPFPSKEEIIGKNISLVDRMYYMGQSYAKGATYAKEHPEIEDEIQSINKQLYDKSDQEINEIYNTGLEWSLQYFETLYKRLGTQFNQYFFESACVSPARELIKVGLGKKIFTESEGAIVFEGEKFQDGDKGEKLHTRVFITKHDLPTYDAKELGLAKLKYEAFQYDKGIVVTANEQDQYFKVNLKVQSLILPETAGKNHHVSHGMMVLPTGKMSSRTGDVVSAEELLSNAKDTALEIMKNREMTDEEKNTIAEQVSIAGIKYLILRQSAGKNVIYDAEKALSFEGDSGPYLQYTAVRANSIIKKAKEQGLGLGISLVNELSNIYKNETAFSLVKKIFIFEEAVERAYLEDSPHHISTYLIELAGLFNGFYAKNKIVDMTDEQTKVVSIEYLALVQSTINVFENGLYLLGIEVPEKM